MNTWAVWISGLVGFFIVVMTVLVILRRRRHAFECRQDGFIEPKDGVSAAVVMAHRSRRLDAYRRECAGILVLADQTKRGVFHFRSYFRRARRDMLGLLNSNLRAIRRQKRSRYEAPKAALQELELLTLRCRLVCGGCIIRNLANKRNGKPVKCDLEAVFDTTPPSALVATPAEVAIGIGRDGELQLTPRYTAPAVSLPG